MTAGKQRRILTQSQAEIVLAEQFWPFSARNTVSIKLYLPDHLPQTVKEAADEVLDSADIFAASFCCCKNGQMLVYGGKKISACSIVDMCSADTAEEYMDVYDRLPFDMERCLYQAEVIPVTGGGVFLYVRFHHIILDEYGMGLFVQKVLDVLEGKGTVRSVFAGDAVCAENVAFHEDGLMAGDGLRNDRCLDEGPGPAVFVQKAAGMKYASYRVRVSDRLMKAAGLFGEKEGISIPYLFAAAYARYLAQASGKKDAVFLMPRLNRTYEQRQTLGCYSLLVPVRVSVEKTNSFPVLCRKVKASAAEAAHKRCVDGCPLLLPHVLGSIFSFHQFSYHASIPYSVRFSVAGDMPNEMTLSIYYNEAGGLDLQIDHQESAFTQEQAGRMGDQVMEILAQGVRLRI